MRFFEWCLVLAVLLPLCLPSLRQRPKWKLLLWWCGPLFLHLCVEGWRWQLFPLYLALLLSCAGLFVLRVAPHWPESAWLRRLWHVGLGLLVCCSILLGVVLPAVTLPGPGGPLAVGVRSWTWFDAKRQKRPVLIKVWYPTVPTQRGARSPYLLNPAATADIAGLPVILIDALRHVRSHAHVDAPMYEPQTQKKLIFFSHGAMGFPSQNTLLAQSLASRGYVVVAVGHRFRPAVIGLPTPTNRTQFQRFFSILTQKTVPQHVADLRFVLARLRSGQDNRFSGQLARYVDLDRFGVAGHSLGGSVALSFCRQDTRCRAVVNLDGHVLGAVQKEGLRIPQLHLSQEMLLHQKDTTVATPQAKLQAWVATDYKARLRRLLRHSKGPKAWYQLRDSGHFSFTDGPWLSPLRFGPFRTIFGTIPTARATRVVNAQTLRWFEQTLRGQKAKQHLSSHLKAMFHCYEPK